MNKLIFSLIAWLTLSNLNAEETMERQTENLVQEQLDAYNARDIESFLVPFAQDVKVFNFPDELIYQGKDKMQETYKRLFADNPDLHCNLIKRIVMGNTAIDHELVTFRKQDPPRQFIAIYKIKDAKIAEVYFIR